MFIAIVINLHCCCCVTIDCREVGRHGTKFGKGCQVLTVGKGYQVLTVGKGYQVLSVGVFWARLACLH